ncbi:hypothetical protein BN844_3138 [Pseudomonas sp. SHC52]|nr:hypothetical protein BN844_3138 [Pseudomonas sp. SHC52]
MADATVEDVDCHVVGLRAAPLELHGGEGRGGRLSGVSDGSVHSEPR